MADPKNFTTEKNKARIKRLGENTTDAAGVTGKEEVTEEVVAEEVATVEEVVPVEEVVTEEAAPEEVL